jgi:hypothetical protein
LGWLTFKSGRCKFGVLYDGGTMAKCCNCEGWVVDEPNIKFNFKFTIGTSGAIMIETKQDKTSMTIRHKQNNNDGKVASSQVVVCNL